MDTVVKEVAQQVPALVVLAWIVYQFTKFLSGEGAKFRESLERVEGRSHSMVKESLALLRDNTLELEKVKGGLRTIADIWDSDFVIDETKLGKEVRYRKTKMQLKAGTAGDAGA